MQDNNYIKRYETFSLLRTAEDYDSAAKENLKKKKSMVINNWEQETIPKDDVKSSFKKLLSKPKKRYKYNPKLFIHELINSTDFFSMPYTALYEANQTGDYSLVQNAIFQRAKLQIHGSYITVSGYDHSQSVVDVLHLLAAADKQSIQNLYIDCGLTTNGNKEVVGITNIIMGLFFNEKNFVDTGYKQVKEFCALKKTSKQDVAIGEYLMAIADKNEELISSSIEKMVSLIPKSKEDSILSKVDYVGKFLCVELHGLLNLALMTDAKGCIDTNELYNKPYICKEYVEFLVSSNFPNPKPYIEYTGEAKALNPLTNKPLPKCQIVYDEEHKTNYFDTDKFVEDQIRIVEDNVDLENLFNEYMMR